MSLNPVFCQLLVDFERAQLRQQSSPLTIRNYRRALRSLFEFLVTNGCAGLGGLTQEHLERWQDLLQARPLDPSSRAQAGTAVRQFIRWAAGQDILDGHLERSIAKIKCTRRKPRPIPAKDLGLLTAFLAPRRPEASALELRDRALFYFLLETGARISEALQVPRTNFERAWVRQKGGSEKELRIGPRVIEMTLDYLAARDDNLPYLWVASGRSGARRLRYADLRKIWSGLASKVGVATWTTHQLRHTCATELLEAGLPALVVADHLGHHGLRHLAVYGQVRSKQRREVFVALEALVGGKIRQELVPKLSSRGR